jgi:hypothetical protein
MRVPSVAQVDIATLKFALCTQPAFAFPTVANLDAAQTEGQMLFWYPVRAESVQHLTSCCWLWLAHTVVNPNICE